MMRCLWRPFLTVILVLQVVLVTVDLVDLLVFGVVPSQRRIVHTQIGTLWGCAAWAWLGWNWFNR